MKKFLSLMLALAMVFSLAACGNNAETPSDSAAPSQSAAPSDSAEPSAEPSEDVGINIEEYNKQSTEAYNAALGEFLSSYEGAKEEITDMGKRFAMMAIAEAKMLESGTMLPTTSNGGRNGLSYIVPRTANTTLWGNDSDRYYNAISTNEMMTAADSTECRELWNELHGTGTYRAEVIKLLEGKGYTLAHDFPMLYSSDPETWDIFATSRANDAEAIVNTYDGLMMYDEENVQQPALAESCEKTVNEDGTVTYTFKIRQGVKWVDSQGREVADVKADDWVAGMQHMMDAMGGLEYLVDGTVVGAHEYIARSTYDMSTVGVKAVDDYTLEYTLTQDFPYFLTMLSYSIFAPMSRSYFESQGGAFGEAYEAAAGSASYTYGTSPNNIAYCGPYLVTNATEKNTIVFTKNPSYYNPDIVWNDTITWKYDDGTDEAQRYTNVKNRTVTSAALTSSMTEMAKTEGIFDEYARVGDTDATTFMNFTNLNRIAFANTNDNTKGISPKDDAQKELGKAAMLNQHFRLALHFATDRASRNAVRSGEDLKYNNLRNSYTPGDFVTLPNETTISINGTDTTFPAGTFYGEIIQAQLDADGVPIKAWDAELGSSDGYDGWYNPENAKAQMDLAVQELAAEGYEVTAENPVYVDLMYQSSSETYSNQANIYKQSVEAALGGLVVVNIVGFEAQEDWLDSGYNMDYGYEMNYDLYDLSGWSPDYGDPQTYLDTMLPDYAGYMAKVLGVF